MGKVTSKPYQRPDVRTLSTSQVLEALGPAAAGPSGTSNGPWGDDFDPGNAEG
jgi:hypothetical protein